MKITWFGHSCFRIDTGSTSILIDPFLTGNATFEEADIPLHKAARGVTHVALTHGHEDHTGDTAIFSDMGLINEIYAPVIGFVPIGDRYTMGAKTAALVCKRFFQFELIVPCHYGTFPVLDETADKFIAEMGGNTVLVPEVGVPFEA